MDVVAKIDMGLSDIEQPQFHSSDERTQQLGLAVVRLTRELMDSRKEVVRLQREVKQLKKELTLVL